METPLRKARSETSETQLEVAESLGIDQGHYSRIERGSVTPSPELARRIAEHFQNRVTPIEILDPAYYVGTERKAS